VIAPVTAAEENARPNLSGRRVGLIGLGLMGKPMARALAACGAEVTVCSRSRAPVDELAGEGMTPAPTPADVAAQVDDIILMLTDTPAVEAVSAASAPALGPGKLIIDMGTTAVLATRGFAAAVAARGAEWLDAPVSGGTAAAGTATLTIMAGGSAAAFARALPLFQAMGRRITHVGDVGAGQVAKAANQVIVGLTIGAVAEALALVRAAGVDPAKVREAIRGGFAESRILELHGGRMVADDFAPGARATVQAKDMRQALDLAAAFGLDLPATALSRELYEKLIDQGGGGLDHAALYRLY
jgi:3-hydroxyisobutyrate dehydrogenase-like beta-hydroxyacid dehydrogenase